MTAGKGGNSKFYEAEDSIQNAARTGIIPIEKWRMII